MDTKISGKSVMKTSLFEKSQNSFSQDTNYLQREN